MLRIAFVLTVTSLVALAGQVEAMNSTSNTRVLCDDGVAQFSASVIIFNAPSKNQGLAKVRLAGKKFPPNTPMVCGYHCAVSGTDQMITCGRTNNKGKFGVVVAGPFVPNTCVGIVPFANASGGPNCILNTP